LPKRERDFLFVTVRVAKHILQYREAGNKLCFHLVTDWFV